MSDLSNANQATDVQATISSELAEVASESSRKRAMRKLGMAALSAIPWAGPFVVAGIELACGDGKIDELQRQWLEAHREKLEQLQDTLLQIAKRLEGFGDEIDARIEDPKFLSLVEKAFQNWDRATTDEKRGYIRRLIANAAASDLCSDDLVRMFLDWIDRYDETHFRVIEAVFNTNGITRRDIWQKLQREIPRDDSSEADIFKLLMDDLALGHVLRQKRQVTPGGKFLKKSLGRKAAAVRGTARSDTMKSPFDGVDPYELTAAGKQFVHYVMDEVAPQLGRHPPGAPR